MDCLLKEPIEVVVLSDQCLCNVLEAAYEARSGVRGCPWRVEKERFRVKSLSLLRAKYMRLLLSSISFTTSVTPKMCWATYLIVRHRPCAACSWLSCLNDNAAGTMPRVGSREMSNCDNALDNLANHWQSPDKNWSGCSRLNTYLMYWTPAPKKRAPTRIWTRRTYQEAGSTPTSAVPGGWTKINQVSLKRTRQIFRIWTFLNGETIESVNFKSVCRMLSHAVACSFPIRPRGKKIKNVPKFYLIWQELGSESSIIQTTQRNESFSQVRKKECNPRTLTNISFEQNVPTSQGLVTSEASVLCFFCIYSFPVCASLLDSAESSGADESISRWKPVFQIIDWNELKYLSNMQIWCLNYSSW